MVTIAVQPEIHSRQTAALDQVNQTESIVADLLVDRRMDRGGNEILARPRCVLVLVVVETLTRANLQQGQPPRQEDGCRHLPPGDETLQQHVAILSGGRLERHGEPGWVFHDLHGNAGASPVGLDHQGKTQLRLHAITDVFDGEFPVPAAALRFAGLISCQRAPGGAIGGHK
jgi:hypothetical protein